MRLLLGALALLATLMLAPSSAQAASPVSVVYFYPRGQEPSAAYLVDPAIEGMRTWFEAHVAATFDASPVEVVRGRQHASVYQADPWSPILRELGYYCGTGVHIIVVHEAISPNYGGGGACSGDRGGTAVVSERWLGSGVPPHELGHAFGLPHPAGCGMLPEPDHCADTVMWAWWSYPNVGLTDSEIAILEGHPAFDGDEPQPCKPMKGKGKAKGRCR